MKILRVNTLALHPTFFFQPYTLHPTPYTLIFSPMPDAHCQEKICKISWW
ncbi:MAG: hypothetical protein F6J93_12805 [Oscillatoria sp. SIO1A7]|nr:hypothetical protein [Oscillatoria sp. SIO1A7]